MKKLLATTICLSLAVSASAEQNFAYRPPPQVGSTRPRETLKERLIGSFVKTFAKSYVATHNLEQFKQKNIKKIWRMDEAKFQRVYNKIYQETMVDLPQHLKDLWGVEENMTREKAVARMNAFENKKQIYKIINSIPNKMIAHHFKKHKKDFDKTMKKKNGSGVDGIVNELLTDPGESS